jgi:hypothetical protein
MRNRAAVAGRVPLILLAVIAGCQRTPKQAFVAHGRLPPASSGMLKFAGTPPAHPFHKEAGNYFARTVFEADGPKDSHIEVRDILIPPHTKSEIGSLPGPAVIEVADGRATLSAGNKTTALVVSTMSELPPAQALRIENDDARPAIVRLYIIRAR